MSAYLDALQCARDAEADSLPRPLAHMEASLERAEEHPLAEIGRYTGEAFAYVRSNVALQRLDVRRRVPRWVEGWSGRVTGQHLQIDENDLWIAAQAVERNLVVVTGDRDFTQVIAPALPELRTMPV
ncbi:PIN domain-containing protein [uncultured Enterovirga sp.]|uniref:PIN domain-containing protein n=1 Tax=uncultured Enterovirga sp. TaxID=2026352 RepID=UPI0035C9EAD8